MLHCAAKVGDWGPVEEYRAVNVEALRGLLDACRNQPLKRFVHFSSLGVYAARHHHGTDETEPLPAHHIDGYTQTKVESEQLVLSYHREHSCRWWCCVPVSSTARATAHSCRNCSITCVSARCARSTAASGP